MNQGPRRMDFRCDGANPPPCTVLSGDETDFITDFYAGKKTTPDVDDVYSDEDIYMVPMVSSWLPMVPLRYSW